MLRSFVLSFVGVALLFAGVTTLVGAQSASSGAAPPRPCEQDKSRVCVVLDDFESYTVDAVPTKWQTNHYRDIVPLTRERIRPSERFLIKQEGTNKFVRAMMKDQAHRMIYTNDNQFDWSLNAYPYLRWRWRAVDLPEGADETDSDKNDTGAAVYVTFDKDWLGRPKSIKYTYSSTQPVGTTASYGPLKVIVVASAPDNGMGKWMTLERNVAEDYRRLFGDEPPSRPAGIILWSDSDTMHTDATADFDDVTLVTAPQ